MNIPDLLSKTCFRCSSPLFVEYIRARKNYSQKNNWGYWTEKDSEKEKYLCDNCLITLYKLNKTDFRLSITNSKKRNLLRYYINTGIIKKGKPKSFFSK